ncbi:MAG: FAD-dependent oxidoreductase [Clostridia bacterium]|nr:FAD-dependent oxidoreductase [Clostridia bacterium]
MNSLWKKDMEKPDFKSFSKAEKTDVLIIGGGIAGILCAYKLNGLGVDCMLVEADEICSGNTQNTTAKITVSHSLIYSKLIDRYGKEKASLYLRAQTKAKEEYERLAQTIDCDYEKMDSYVYTLRCLEKIKNEVSALNSLGVRAELSDAGELPINVLGAVRVRNQAQFHPLKLLYNIARELPIYEHTKVIGLKPGRALTNHGEIIYKKVIIATHFPVLNKHGLYPLKLYQHRSYVIALDGVEAPSGMYVDESEVGLSFRSYGNLLLLGGGGHRTGKQGGCWRQLEDFASEHYPGASVVAKWAAQDCISLDGVSYIGKYSKATPDIFVATGFNKWGMTNAMAAADILSDLIVGKDNPYAAVFSPSRSILCKQLFSNAFESAVGLLTPTAPRCPHLGCALKYNRAEHSWDCPCHGSRFSENGELIDNPATDDKKGL